MHVKSIALCAAMFAIFISNAFAECESGHWVDTVSDNGAIVTLEDDSIWQIAGGDTINTALWLPTTDITACDDLLINTEDKETAHALRIR